MVDNCNDMFLFSEMGIKSTLVLHMLQLWAMEIKAFPLEDRYAHLGFYAFEEHLEKNVGDFMLDLMGNLASNARRHGYGCTPLQYNIATGGSFTRAVLERNPDLHGTIMDCVFSPNQESPTSLAMYFSWAFAMRQADLKHFGIDFEEFVEKEMLGGPLVKANWTLESLSALFQLQYYWKCNVPVPERCSDYSGFLHKLRIQPS